MWPRPSFSIVAAISFARRLLVAILMVANLILIEVNSGFWCICVSLKSVNFKRDDTVRATTTSVYK